MTSTARSTCGTRDMIRSRRVISLLVLVFLVGTTLVFLKRPAQLDPISLLSGHHAHEENTPLPPANSQSHPIYQLISEAESAFQTTQARQSRSLSDAVAEYRRRYKIPP